MFVRWQQHQSRAQDKRRRERNDARARLKAVLVESVRIAAAPSPAMNSRRRIRDLPR
jgi:hypothetical protein